MKTSYVNVHNSIINVFVKQGQRSGFFFEIKSNYDIIYCILITFYIKRAIKTGFH